MLGGSELGNEVPDVSGVEAKITECRSDGDFILYDINDLQVDLVMRHVELFC